MAIVIEEGRPAPNFSLPDAGGRTVSLTDFRGRDVIVYFYPKDDTPGCTKEACGFRDHWTELQKAGVVVLGVSADGPASHARFAAKYRLPFPLLSDPERKVMAAWGDKVLYGRKTQGVIRSTVWIGPDGTVRRRWPRVKDAVAHPAEVVRAVLGGGAEAPTQPAAARPRSSARSARPGRPPAGDRPAGRRRASRR
ncbi:MAG: peroxiredoxin [Candidatus Rokubacteria bacterium]|nr:peroxiredoxin [Candidatus Rokubacteria bacterium]